MTTASPTLTTGRIGIAGVSNGTFAALALGVAILFYGLLALIANEYLYFASYVVLQFVVMATAWNILGGYCGYVNFGSAAFFAIGAYTTVCVCTIITELGRMPPARTPDAFAPPGRVN